MGRRSLAIVCDVTDPESVSAAVEHVAGALGRIDILVNGAGTTSRTPAVEMSRDDWTSGDRHQFDRHLLDESSGRSQDDPTKERKDHQHRLWPRPAVGLPRRISYTASKGGVMQLTRALAAEWASLGICVNAISPGFFHTEINDVLFRDDKWRESLVSRIAAGSPESRRPGRSRHLPGQRSFGLRLWPRLVRRRWIYDVRHDLTPGMRSSKVRTPANSSHLMRTRPPASRKGRWRSTRVRTATPSAIPGGLESERR